MSAADAIGVERLEALLRGGEPRTPAEERRATLLAGLRAASLPAPEALRARVLASAPAGRGRVPRRRLALAAVSVAAALAAGVAVTAYELGGTGSGTKPASLAAPSLKAVPEASPPATEATLVVRVAGEPLSRAVAEAARIAVSLGGSAVSVVQPGASRAGLELRVPAGKAKTALARLAALGTVVSKRLPGQVPAAGATAAVSLTLVAAP
jgi:hypothetical protein